MDKSLIKMANLAKILDNDPYYSSSENRDKVFFVEDLIPTVQNPIEMLYEWEARGLSVAGKCDVDALNTKLYCIKNLELFLINHNLPLIAALFPDSGNNSSELYFSTLMAKYFGTEYQGYFEQKRCKNILLNQFFFYSEIIHREDYHQFESSPISQSAISDKIRTGALEKIQETWLELKQNKFNDELYIVQKWIDEYISSMAYCYKWEIVKELSGIDNSIREYESLTPENIIEVDIRDRRLASLRERMLHLQTSSDTINESSATDSGRSARQDSDSPSGMTVYDPMTANHAAKVREAARLEIENKKLRKGRRLTQAEMAKKVLGTEYRHQDPTRQYRALRDEAIKARLIPE